MIALACLGLGCATGRPPEDSSHPEALTSGYTSTPALEALAKAQEDRTRIVEAAQALLGKRRIEVNGRKYPSDCTGLVRAAYASVGVNLLSEGRPGDNGVTAIYRFATARGRIYTGGWPVAGDLVFFRDTYDKNHDGRVNDGLTHVALVEKVEDDRTVWILHRVKRGVVRYRMNLSQPNQRTDPKTSRVINDYLRYSGTGSRQVLTGQLFAAYATVLPLSASLLRQSLAPQSTGQTWAASTPATSSR
jgi:hypothetical protein